LLAIDLKFKGLAMMPGFWFVLLTGFLLDGLGSLVTVESI